MPDPLIVGMLKFHVRHHGAQQMVAQRDLVIAEARRRGIRHSALVMLDPPPCHCGRKGLYIVGHRTFCRVHRDEAREALAPRAQRLNVLSEMVGKEVRERRIARESSEQNHAARGLRRQRSR